MTEIEELKKEVTLLKISNEKLLEAVKLMNKRIDVATEKYNLLFEYCKKLREGIDLIMGS